MTDFDALLKRSFAEAHEPADDGFVANVTQVVAKRETGLKVRGYLQLGAVTIGAAAVSWSLYSVFGSVFGALGPELMASAGVEAARARAALSMVPDAGAAAQGFIQSMGAGLTQVLLVTAALAGGAVAYRSSQQ